MITRERVRKLRDKIDGKLKGLDGLHVIVGSARYSETSVTFKVELAVVDESGEVQDRTAQAFRRYASCYGLDPDLLGKKVRIRNKAFTVTGLNTRAKKYPVQAKDERGQAYKLALEDVMDAVLSK